MSEILFRGKTTLDNEWVIGAGVYKSEGYTWIITDDVTRTESRGTGSDAINPETVGQYTGLTDKHGEKIFEGDIVAGAVHWLERSKNGVVAFRDGSFGLIWYRGNIEQFNPFTSMCNVEYEVIGNIHDNLELLKGGAE